MLQGQRDLSELAPGANSVLSLQAPAASRVATVNPRHAIHPSVDKRVERKRQGVIHRY